MKFAAFTTVAGSGGEATSAEEHIDNLRQQTILAEEARGSRPCGSGNTTSDHMASAIYPIRFC